MNEHVKIVKSENPKNVKTIRSEKFREITQDRMFGGFREGYFIYIVQNEIFDSTSEDNAKPVYLEEIQVKVPPQQMVKTYELFSRLIENYEQVFGKIKTIEQIAEDQPNLIEES